MRLLLISLIFIGFSLNTQAQSDDSPRPVQTLFGNKGGFGGYLGMNLKMTQVNDQDALLTGGEVAFVFNRSLNFGFEGYGMVNQVLSDNLSNELDPLYLQLGYGGLHIEPVIASESLIHITLPILIGAGGIGETRRPYWDEHDGEVHIDFEPEYTRADYFFVAEPGLDLELNLFKFMRIAAGASYRFTTDFEMGTMDEQSINGWNGNISLRIGWF